MTEPYYSVKINLKSKPVSVTKPIPKPDFNTEDNSPINNSPIDNFYHNQIRDLYDHVIDQFRSGGYAVYNPRLLHYLTIEKFTEWVFENNLELKIHKN
jgi:hypothetical protein